MDNAAYEKPPPYTAPGENPPPPPPPPYNVSSQPMANPIGPTTITAPHAGLQYPNVYPPLGYGYQPNYGTTVTIQPATDIIIVGGCPVCRVGILETDFTCLGVLCAIFFFPLGVLFCLALRQHRCANCGALFG